MIRLHASAMARTLRLAAVLLAAVPLAGCARPLGTIMASTPNRINPLARPDNPLPPMESVAADQHFQVPVGPPEASLAVAVIEPAERQPPRGTILVLHGIYARGMAMVHTARRLSAVGYRSVLVDLRGHGRSSGEYLSFGPQEARDVSQVISALDQRRLIAGQIGVYGVSYGATTSIHLAACDPRVRAVVAVEPFAMVRPEVPQFGQTMVPGVGLLIPEKTYQHALDEAGRIGGFDPDRSDAVDAIQRTRTPVLLVHGTSDWIVPYWNSVLLHQAAPNHSELVTIPWQGHTALWADLNGTVSDHARVWFDRWLKSPK